MIEPLAQLPDAAKETLRKADPPEWTEPMLATLTDRRFSDEGWIFERRLDGERGLVFRTGRDVRLMSRNQKSLNATYPELVDALQQQRRSRFIADGEIVAFSGGITSFSRLQDRMQIDDPEEAQASSVAVYYYLFDLLHLEGYDLTRVDLRHRKAVLKKAFQYGDPLRFMPHRNTEGEAYYEDACQKGWEGVIAKEAASRYVHSRSTHWLKFKCVQQQEFIIGGFTEPHGERVGFGALLLGYYDGNDLVYAGKVGTGFDEETLNTLRDQFSSMERDDPPFDRGDLPRKEVHWLDPELVAQIGFEEWTAADRLRQPRFQGVRRDKNPDDVVKETPQA